MSSCKSQFTADNKTELALICIEQFPQVEKDRKTDTIYEDREVFIIKEIDCDSIGTKDVQIQVKYKDRIVKETVIVRDTARDFLVVMLQAEKESLDKQITYLEDERMRINLKHKKELKDKDKSHKKEIKEANKFRNRLIGWGAGLAGLFVLIRFVLR